MANASFDGGLFPIWLQYEGRDADHHLIDLYDFSVALRGFERGLALTSHFVLNNEIITQVTAVRGVKILCSPPEVGSLRIPAYLAATGLAVHSIGSLEPNNPIGHLIFRSTTLRFMKRLANRLIIRRASGKYTKLHLSEALRVCSFLQEPNLTRLSRRLSRQSQKFIDR